MDQNPDLPIKPFSYSPLQFSIFRISLGLHLFIFYCSLIPYAEDLFGQTGMFSRTLFKTPFPSFFFLTQSNLGIQSCLNFFALLSLLFATGFQRRFFAVLLWYGSTSILNRIPFLSLPSEGFIGWLLLASALVPEGEPYSVGNKKRDQSLTWHFPEPLYQGAWIVFSISYMLSGIEKFHGASWYDGTALEKIWSSPTARSNSLITFLLLLPEVLTKLLTWIVLATEIFIPFLGLFKLTRLLSWIGITAFHLGILLTLNLNEISSAMLISQLFLFDATWLKKLPFQNKT